MMHTPIATEHDHEIEDFIGSIDPATMRDARNLRAVSAARIAVEQSELLLIESVRAARVAGDSWTMIGVALHTSKQNAHRKFAPLIGESTSATAPMHERSALQDSLVKAIESLNLLFTLADSSEGEEVNMPNNNDRHVVPGKDGGWDVVKEGSTRPSSHHNTQADAISRGREIVANAGGGELNIHGRNGQIRAKDTIPHGNDPRSSKG